MLTGTAIKAQGRSRTKPVLQPCAKCKLFSDAWTRMGLICKRALAPAGIPVSHFK